MSVDLLSFNLTKLPLFYVAGIFEATSPWTHKHMYQPGNWEIIFVVKGSMYLAIEDKQYVIKANQYFLVPPYQNLVGYKQCPTGSKFLWIHFFPRDSVTINDQTVNDDYYVATIPRQSTMFNQKQLLAIAYQVIDLAESSHGYTVDIAVAQLLLFISDDYHELIKSHHSNPSSVENIKTWINSHLSEIDNSSQIATAFNFNVIYLNRIFKKECHVSLYQYVLDQKIEQAKLLLTATDKTAYEISEDVYFKDAKNFSRTFKRKVGITPMQYRQTFNHHTMHTPTYDPVVPISDRFMSEVLKNNSPYGKSPKK